jgi:hypothetical protein
MVLSAAGDNAAVLSAAVFSLRDELQEKTIIAPQTNAAAGTKYLSIR